MAIKYKTIKNDFPRIKQALESINGRKLIIGASGDDAWLVGIHEYGCVINVTPKMRAYLHGKGLHLKDTTTQIIIPERSFMRAGHDACVGEVMNKADKVVGQLIAGKITEEQLFDMIGLAMSTQIKTYARDLAAPPNHPFTQEQKGSSNPLVDTGQMIESITWEVE